MGTVDGVIPAAADGAATVQGGPERQATAGCPVSMVVRLPRGADPVLDAMQALSADARERGLTPELLDEELRAHKAERRR